MRALQKPVIDIRLLSFCLYKKEGVIRAHAHALARVHLQVP